MAQAVPKNPYKVVPIPAGYRRALPKEITPKVQRAAVRALQQCLPLGKMQATEVGGKMYCFVTEGHYDDHVTKPGKPIWHPGISTLVPINQPKKVASQAVRDAQFVSQSRMTGESLFGADSAWTKFKKWLFAPVPTAPKARVTPQMLAAGQMLADEAAASTMRGEHPLLAARQTVMHGDDVHFTGDFGDDVGDDPHEEDLESTYAADELYDAVGGDDFGGDDFGDEFGAARRKAKKKAKGKAKTKVQVRAKAKVKGKVTLGARKKRNRFAPRKAAARPAPRPAPRPAARPTARPAPRPAVRPVAARPYISPRTTPTRTDSPLGPSAPFDNTMLIMVPSNDGGFAPAPEPMEMAEQSMPEQSSAEIESALDNYESGGDETPETADEGSDTYDASAVNGEGFTHDKFSVGA